jgi:hypothetical protein
MAVMIALRFKSSLLMQIPIIKSECSGPGFVFFMFAG